MAQLPPPHEPRSVFFIPLPGFPLYYLPRSRKIVSLIVPPVEKKEDQRAHEQKDRELDEGEDHAAHHGPFCRAQAAAGQHALHHHVVRAVGGEG